MRAFSGHDGRIFVGPSLPPSLPLSLSLPSAMASHVARVTFPPVHPPERASERASAFHLSIWHSCQIPVYRQRPRARRGAQAGGWRRHPRQSTQQRTKEATGGGGSGRASGGADALTHSLTHCPSPPRRAAPRRAGCHRRFRIKIKSERRRPKSILGFCPDEFICLGHLTLHDFPPLSTPTEPNSLLSGRDQRARPPARPPARQVMSPRAGIVAT